MGSDGAAPQRGTLQHPFQCQVAGVGLLHYHAVFTALPAQGAEKVGGNGMVTFHGYTLMDLGELNGIRLLKIR